jgi:LytS/YehU family sensor histidine kinase
MMLLTLVENAIKHGIDPLVEGGRVEITAERREATLCVEVADNGRGFASAEGTGTGLANIRARLSMLYGARAALALAHRTPRGFVACLRLPLEYAR